jgi:hypothetical protein
MAEGGPVTDPLELARENVRKILEEEGYDAWGYPVKAEPAPEQSEAPSGDQPSDDD